MSSLILLSVILPKMRTVLRDRSSVVMVWLIGVKHIAVAMNSILTQEEWERNVKKRVVLK